VKFPAAVELAAKIRHRILQPDWRSDALCAQVDAEIFYPDQGGGHKDALSICYKCPARLDCLIEAVQSSEQFGIWGGTTPSQRRTIARLLHADPQEDRSPLKRRAAKTRARNEKIRRLYAHGWSAASIAAAVDTTERTTLRVIAALKNQQPAAFEAEPTPAKSA